MSQQLLVAMQDEPAIQQLTKKLPHALLIVAEAGADTDAVVDTIVQAHSGDLQRIQPAKDKRFISVDQVRSFIDTTHTYASRPKIALIQPAETMTAEAQNSLLKTLEEPSSQLHLILQTTATDDLLPTVLSRCQTLTLHRTSSAQDTALLDALAVEPAIRQQILFLGAGRPTLIRQLATDAALLASYQHIASDAKRIMSEVTLESLAVAQAYSGDRHKALQLTDVILTMARFQLQRGTEHDRTIRLIEAAAHTETILKQNGNSKLALLNLAIRSI